MFCFVGVVRTYLPGLGPAFGQLFESYPQSRLVLGSSNRAASFMKVKKSSRHSKITGNFAENLILYWLSKYNFECANVDHTGIDIIAKNPKTRELMGISVKSRSRKEGTEGEYLGINNDNFIKIKSACRAFGCIPYFAFVIDERDKIHCFILSMKKLLKMFPKGKKILAWKMGEKYLKKYYEDPEIKVFEFTHKTHSWWR